MPAAPIVTPAFQDALAGRGQGRFLAGHGRGPRSRAGDARPHRRALPPSTESSARSSAGSAPEAAEVWVLDPIDGTRAFVAGKPIFGTLIALLRDRQADTRRDRPAGSRRTLGRERRGRDRAFAASRFRDAGAAPSSGRAILNTTSPAICSTGADRDAFRRLSQSVRSTTYGGDCYAYGLLASGHIDLVVEAGLKAYDFLRAGPGGRRARAGASPTGCGRGARMRSSDGRVIAAGDPRAHEKALELLARGTN